LRRYGAETGYQATYYSGVVSGKILGKKAIKVGLEK
jgi:hypothetical protein